MKPSPCHSITAGLFLWGCLIFTVSYGRCELPEGAHLSGQLKSLNLCLDTPPTGKGESGVVSSNSIRLDLTMPMTETTTLEFALEGKGLYAAPTIGLTLPRKFTNRRLDLERTWSKEGWFSQQLDVDRLNVHSSHFGMDWTLGRQAIGFGRISLFSPLDIIAPFPPDAIDTEVRPGVDALRASHYFGVAGQTGATLVFGQRPEQNSYLIYGEDHLDGIDLLAIAGQLRERPMAGVGFATQLGGMGIKGESICYQGHRVGEIDGDLRHNFTLAAVEADYRFNNGLILFVQYLYNGTGVDAPVDYPKAAASAPIREGLSYFLGQHYLLLASTYELHPLITLNGLLICNLKDSSFLLRPLLHLSLSDNWGLELFWGFNQGQDPQKNCKGPGIFTPRSEFGSHADIGGLLLKYFY